MLRCRMISYLRYISSMALAQGDKIGVYEILAPISGRGMCEAYKALEAGHFIPGQSVPITEFLE